MSREPREEQDRRCNDVLDAHGESIAVWTCRKYQDFPETNLRQVRPSVVGVTT